jgi:hypothetical protein
MQQTLKQKEPGQIKASAKPARLTKQDHVLAAMKEVELAEVLDDLLLDRALEGEVELLERLACREPGCLDPGLSRAETSVPSSACGNFS